MSYSIQQATVIGAGTMGAGIAALLANAGISVYLLDIVPSDLTKEEMSEGLDLENPQVRNRYARNGLERIMANPKIGLDSPELAERIGVGNLEDDFDWVADSDWVIEAIVEDLEIKQRLMKRIDGIRKPMSIITTNTSGLPIKDIVEGTSAEFSQHFLGTHFFNPPRIMKLLEIIPGINTDPALLDFMIEFCEERLLKGVVVCKDTPNFIANRIAAIQRSFDMEYAIKEGYSVEEADAILGPVIGRPKTALFRLGDLVGIDVSMKVGKNLYDLIPHDEFRELLLGEESLGIRERMIATNLLGRKTGSGFYQRVETQEGMQFWGLNLDTVEYRKPITPEFPRLEKANELEALPERINFLISGEDRLGQMVWASLSNVLRYAAYTIPEISESLVSVDRAMRWGYSWQMGPFELWDALGVGELVERIKSDGHGVAKWVTDMLDAGEPYFYKLEDGQRLEYSPVVLGFQATPN